MDTFLGLVAVFFVFLLLALPSLVGHAHDRRITRQLRAAERAPLEPRAPRTESADTPARNSRRTSSGPVPQTPRKGRAQWPSAA
ncbi:hypothetical protein [Streptomyces sp. H27-D2]|uniref:hypothetical protein n=1 Tax=Streptomyces sp. H27-D2 TaxID=3046304 RepID=UPI002DBF5EF5|nr:hypothetical protein [Streptomyces sp. H27-D2]MEC4019491.1 hypothetical protein [Streptomyces sp. H27-D2]